ncbi:hypothetical protein VTO73DRAFT_10166 [Trametes versicolor]
MDDRSSTPPSRRYQDIPDIPGYQGPSATKQSAASCTTRRPRRRRPESSVGTSVRRNVVEALREAQLSELQLERKRKRLEPPAGDMTVQEYTHLILREQAASCSNLVPNFAIDLISRQESLRDSGVHISRIFHVGELAAVADGMSPIVVGAKVTRQGKTCFESDEGPLVALYTGQVSMRVAWQELRKDKSEVLLRLRSPLAVRT